MTERPDRGPILDLRVRWRAGQVALAAAALMAAVALLRPLGPGASPRLRLAVTLLLGLGIAATALLASLRNRGTAEQLAFYVFLVLCLDGLGQIVAPLGWPVWPLLTLLVGAVAVAEPPAIAFFLAALAALLAASDAAVGGFTAWRAAAAAALGWGALVLALHQALRGEKRRLGTALAELARVHHGIDHLQDGDAEFVTPPGGTGLRQVSEQGRRSRQAERAAELDRWLAGIVAAARQALDAHAVLCFDFDRDGEKAYLRAADGPPALSRDSVLDLRGDPFAFLLDRGESFYATDFKRLLWSLPYYKGEVKVGTLLAVPVHTAGVVRGALVVDKLEIQALGGGEAALAQSFASLVAEAMGQLRAVASREDVGTEFKAVYDVSRQIANLTDPVAIRLRLLGCARDLVPHEGAAVVMSDRAQTRYVVENAEGWASEFEGRETGMLERTWMAWLLKSEESSLLLDDLQGGRDRMPVLVLDEGRGRAESLLAVALRTQQKTIGALVLTGRRATFDSATQRVLAIVANQAAGALHAGQMIDHAREAAIHDALTGLHNRRAFNEFLERAVAREDRQGGHFSLLLLDIDRFKKLNDTYGHPAGDAALRHTAQLLAHHVRKSDLAARVGGEEFAVLLASTDASGAGHLAEKVRAEVEKGRLVYDGARLAVTVSVGVAVWPQDGREPAALVAAADRALYAAKEGGRNRVVVAATLGDPVPASPRASA
ncbi:MAG TPA: diguanylate cyclase [Vicinamibacteria bacterium]|nr:diguanylate cyclase [Vicinamibacteria bacterium]